MSESEQIVHVVVEAGVLGGRHAHRLVAQLSTLDCRQVRRVLPLIVWATVFLTIVEI